MKSREQAKTLDGAHGAETDPDAPGGPTASRADDTPGAAASAEPRRDDAPGALMDAVVLERCCAPEDLRVSRVAVPRVKPGHVLVRVRAFGLNRSELMLRAFEANEDHIRLPRIPGIECAGEAADPGDSGLAPGERVVALMGGMGRSFDGSYAEYALVPSHHVFSVERAAAGMPWDELAAVPETWSSAWGSLFTCLHLKPGESLLIRGATSALGIAAAQIAHAIGCTVCATTRSERKGTRLIDAGLADRIRIERVDGSVSPELPATFEADGAAAEHGHDTQRYDAVLDLIGPAAMRASLRLARPQGCVCVTGLLGGADTIDGFDPIRAIPNGVALTSFHSNWPDQKTIDAVFAFIRTHGTRPVIGARYEGLGGVTQAHADMEASRIFGKAVVVLA